MAESCAAKNRAGCVIKLWLALAVWLTSPITASLAQAENAPPPWVGVWRGTIGSFAIQVCLQHRQNEQSGAYFYLRHLGIISLGALAAKTARPAQAWPVWTEAPFSDKAANGPIWHLNSASSGHLQGVWRDGAKSLPIDLTQVAMVAPKAGGDDLDDSDQPCGNMAFSLPRFTKPVITTRPAQVMGVGYNRVLIDPGPQFSESKSETFQLAGASPAIQRVNAALYKHVPTSPDHAAYVVCSMAALGQNGVDGSASSRLTPLVLTAGWLVSEEVENEFCGGAHPNVSFDYAIWDLRSGGKVNVYDWFSKAALTQAPSEPDSKDAAIIATYTPAFRKLIDAAYPRTDADCREAAGATDRWMPHLTPKGMAFTPDFPHVVMACTEDAVISFVRLAPFLNPVGQAKIADFRAGLKPTP